VTTGCRRETRSFEEENSEEAAKDFVTERGGATKAYFVYGEERQRSAGAKDEPGTGGRGRKAEQKKVFPKS
jgi:hypothetical protein